MASSGKGLVRAQFLQPRFYHHSLMMCLFQFCAEKSQCK